MGSLLHVEYCFKDLETIKLIKSSQTTLQIKCYYYHPHFTDEETET